MADSNMITVITPTLNAEATILSCLAGDQQGVKYQRLYVDGGSSDRTLEFLGEKATLLPRQSDYPAPEPL